MTDRNPMRNHSLTMIIITTTTITTGGAG
ncbi:TPA: thr operon leader peptide [Morganella morganii]|nr:thr operon leader peptide [Morganella morganii]EBS5739802.1 thr operon leader peptide [Salmonella enterica subsp. enterica serovar Eastbourne]EBV1760755.1 thr operon leader peptide [Salmonella enterica subsp. enterica serovar Newport]MBS9571284.1 thr operon leader peptide [Morganella morganii subsp. morganii]MCJ1904288.1 thr operon leader peptide [Morganella sp. HSTU-ASny43]NGE22952.1 thr operon leader peptide [Klebsiella pneumoniae]HAS8351011.1 thr operon leader peptide [Vibrio vulnificus